LGPCNSNKKTRVWLGPFCLPLLLV
jgi:hypothetical protein